MAQVKGLSIKQIDKRADRFVALIESELRGVARKAAAGLGQVTVADAHPAAVTVSDLNKIRALWEAVVDGQLLSILAAALFSSSGATADSINRVVGRTVSEPIGEDTVVELSMKHARNQLVNIGDDYWSEARDTLTEGLQEGESIEDLSARVMEAVEVTRPRAEVIARTEILRASNEGSIVTMRASELGTSKTWLATPDARTRPSHRAADGQTVPMDQPFVLGGEVDDEGNVVAEGVKLDHPLDPLGPANETIQCRCTMTYEIADTLLPDDDEDEPVTASIEQDYSDSGMVALVPSEADAERLALEGGEIPDQLHLTLAYLGEIVEWSEDERDALATELEWVANEKLQPIKANAFGVALWNPDSDNPAWVLSIGGDDLGDAHDWTWNGVLDPLVSEGAIPELAANHSPWVAHVCLAYSTDPEVMQQALASLGDIEFDRIRFAFGDDVFDFPLGGTLTSSTHMEASPMPWYIEKDHEGCSDDTPWAVVKQDDDEVEGCHATKQEALDQMAALYAETEDEEVDAAAKDDKQCPPGQKPGPDGECVPDEESVSSRRTRAAKARRKRALADDKEKNCPPGQEPDADGNCVPVEETASSKRRRKFAADDEDKECPPGQKPNADGECVPDDEEETASGEVRAIGVATREGEWTGDGRQFAEGSLDWPDPETTSIPLQWQKETSHGGMNDVTVNIGWLTMLERVDGGQIAYEAVIDTDSADGLEAARFVAKRGQFGVSIVADDPEQAEVEFVYPDECNEGRIDEGEDIDEIPMSCFMPNVIYHSGRIRALTLVDVPAFADAYIEIPDAEGLTASIGIYLGAVPPHDTETSDAEWSASEQEGKLDSPMSVETAQAMYAWIDDEQIEDDQVTKEACKFPHHEVNDDGTPGAANLTACSAGIGALNGAREEPTIPTEDFQGVYEHLAKHLTDAGQEPPEPEFETSGALMAASYSIEIPDLPPASWFAEPENLPEVGAIRITDEGRVYGLLAPRGVSHRSFQDRKVTVPMGNVDYSRWMNRETLVDGGRVVAGPVTMDCGHASTSASLSAQASRDHYDNSCSVFATVRIGESRDGVWVAGALLPGVTAQQIAQAMACQLSGDWRPHPDKPGKREMCGALLVPVPGFPKENTAQASLLLDNGQLVAASVPVSWETTGSEPIELGTGEQASNSNELDLPTWEEIQAKQALRAQARELATKLGIEVNSHGM